LTDKCRSLEIIPSYAKGPAPASAVADFPFQWPSGSGAVEGARRRDKEGKVKHIAFIDYGYTNILFAKRDVAVPADIKSLKLRLPDRRRPVDRLALYRPQAA
jgi:TRAP-type C4-dicarboxylate transport system substrate-binding protein